VYARADALLATDENVDITRPAAALARVVEADGGMMAESPALSRMPLALLQRRREIPTPPPMPVMVHAPAPEVIPAAPADCTASHPAHAGSAIAEGSSIGEVQLELPARSVAEEVKAATGGAPSLSCWMESLVAEAPQPPKAIDPPRGPRASGLRAGVPPDKFHCVTASAVASFRGIASCAGGATGGYSVPSRSHVGRH